MATGWEKKQTIGFIGVGLMGQAFCRNLTQDGHPVVGTDPAPQARRTLKKLGGTALGSAREVAEAAEVVFLSLPNSKISLHLARAKDGFLAFSSGQAPKTVLDTTTADPEDAKAVARLCRAKGVPFLEACVSGHSGDVAKRRGRFLVAGETRAHRKVAPLLGRMLSDQVFCGPPGRAAAFKILINYKNAMQRCVVAETLRLGRRAGFASDFLLPTLLRTRADCPLLRGFGPKMLARRYSNPTGTQDVMIKDIQLGLTLAERAGADTTVGSSALGIYKEGERSGYGRLDSAVVCRVYEDREKRQRPPRKRD